MDNSRNNLRPATDEQLFAAYRAGDREAFAGLVRRHERELYRFLRRFTGDAAAADDLFQEAFLQVHQSADRFDPTKSFRPWLFTIAANKARDLLRARARRRMLSTDTVIDRDRLTSLIDTLPADDAGPCDLAEAADLHRRVSAVVEALPKIHAEVLRLAYFRQLPYRDIALTLGLPLGTIKSRLHVAVKAFAAAWARQNARCASGRN